MFEYAISNQNKESSVSNYLEFLTSGNIKSEIIFNFSKNLKKQLKKDLITAFNLKSMNLIDTLVNDMLVKVKNLQNKRLTENTQN